MPELVDASKRPRHCQCGWELPNATAFHLEDMKDGAIKDGASAVTGIVIVNQCPRCKHYHATLTQEKSRFLI